MILTTAPVRPLHAPPALPAQLQGFLLPVSTTRARVSFLSAGSRLSRGTPFLTASYSWIRPPRGQRGKTRKRLGVNRSDLQTHKLSLSKEPPKPTPSSLLPRLEDGAPSLPEEANHPQARLKTPVLRQSGPGQCGGRGKEGCAGASLRRAAQPSSLRLISGRALENCQGHLGRGPP